MNAIAPTFGLDPVSLDRAAAVNAKRLVAVADARKLRAFVRTLRRAEASMGEWAFSQWRVGEEWASDVLDIARAEWRDILPWINRRAY